jgi:hypothetical protein
MYREMKDLFYDLTFFCRCMGDSFLSDEKEAGGGGKKNGPASSILANTNQPSVDTTGGTVAGETVHLTYTGTKRSTSTLKRSPRYSPPRRNIAAARSAESPDRSHQEHDDDDDDDGTDGGGTGASSPSCQSRRSSSTGGTYSYDSYTNTHHDDEDDNSTNTSSVRTYPSTSS